MDRLLEVLRRYQPLILTLTAITLIAFLLPQRDDAATSSSEDASALGSLEENSTIEGTTKQAAAGTVTTKRAGQAARSAPVTFEEAKKRGLAVDFGPNCDTQTGRIKVPSRYAPPCVPRFSGPNGGRTWKGVSDKEIVVAVYRAQEDPVADSIVQAAGANDPDEDVQQTFKDWKAYFESHYETYGRKVKLVFVRGSAPAEDDAAARADAKRIALEIGAFAVWAHLGAPAGLVDELTARGILWITGETRPTNFYLERAPFGWGVQMNLDQGFVHAAEYIGKRLWGKKARWSDDATMRTKNRSFGLIYADDDAQANKPATEFFQRELARYGARLTDKVPIVGDTAAEQEQSRPIIQRLKERGITSVMFTGSPLTPIFLTQEATRQQYFPEWVFVGGNLVDTTFFGRTYDQTQWGNGFGLSQLWVRPPKQRTEPWYQHEWQHCRIPTAESEYEIIYQPQLIFYTGVQLAGPTLTPQTFRDGLFKFPSPPLGISSIHRSFGKHGIWPFVDYGAFDDTTEVWWDPNAVGTDEIEKPGKGMYRYVDGGKRYLPGGWPRSEPKAFQPAGTVTQLDDLPAQDRFPRYEDKHCR